MDNELILDLVKDAVDSGKQRGDEPGEIALDILAGISGMLRSRARRGDLVAARAGIQVRRLVPCLIASRGAEE